MASTVTPDTSEPARPTGRGSGVESFTSVIETHTGAVFFVGDKAYKMKKPVRYGFLDFTSREARLTACRREVELNRRLAPDVYLGVADVIGPDGSPFEHLVVMRRLPTGRSLGVLAKSNENLEGPVRALAQRLAAFHAHATRSAPCDISASRDATLGRWESDGTEMAPLVGPLFDPEVHGRVLSLARRYLKGRAALFASRIEAGRARDGHGDLLADDVFCLDDGPRVLDCLEFDDALRFGDVLSDVESMAMDLERLDRKDLAQLFVESYRSYSKDSWPSSLGHHYAAYRAQVRSLVAGLRFDQGDTASVPTAQRLLRMSLEHLETGRVRLVLMGGLPGTGKSTWAAEACRVLDAAWIRSDEVRKRLAGLDPGARAPAPFDEGLYGPGPTAATYEELLAQTSVHLAMGRSVVVDATFSDPAWRARARLVALERSADLDEIRCVAPMALIESRIAERDARGRDPSDATVAVAHELARREGSWPEAVPLATDGPESSVRPRLLAVLGVGNPWPDSQSPPSVDG